MARGDVVVTVEFQVFKGSGNPEPARHGRGFSSRYTRLADDDYVAAAHRPADQHHFQFDRSLRRQIARTKKKYAGRTDVARPQGNRKVSGSAVDTAQRRGRRRLARGYSRCSGKTPTAWVGTRAKRRTGLSGRNGITRSAGTRGAPIAGAVAMAASPGTAGTACGPNGAGRAGYSSSFLTA